MALTNEVLEQRMRAQTDMIQHAQSLAEQAFQKANSLDTRLSSAQAEAAGAFASSQAALKAEDTTQKLLKELIQEIKDLRDDGNVQQKQIDQIRKEMETFKDLVNARINQLHQMIYANTSGTGAFKRSPYGGWEVTSTLGDGTQLISTFDDDGNPTGHTSIMGMDSYTNGVCATTNYIDSLTSEDVDVNNPTDTTSAAGI